MAYANTRQDMFDCDGDFANLSRDANHLWLVLCATPLGGMAGFIEKKNYSVLARQSKMPLEDVEAAMREVIENGSVIENGEYVWVRTRVKHRCNSDGWRKGAWKESMSFYGKCPDLAALCIATHGLTEDGKKQSAEQIANNLKRLSKVPKHGPDGLLQIKGDE